MQTALVDSNVLIGATSSRDSRHDHARKIVAAADDGELPVLRVTNYVLVETINYVAERGRHSKAVELHERLERSPGFELVRVTGEDDQRAIDLFRSSDFLSLVDATLVAHAARNGIDYCYGFDDDFDRIETITRLDYPEDPYEPN